MRFHVGEGIPARRCFRDPGRQVVSILVISKDCYSVNYVVPGDFKQVINSLEAAVGLEVQLMNWRNSKVMLWCTVGKM